MNHSRPCWPWICILSCLEPKLQGICCSGVSCKEMQRLVIGVAGQKIGLDAEGPNHIRRALVPTQLAPASENNKTQMASASCLYSFLQMSRRGNFPTDPSLRTGRTNQKRSTNNYPWLNSVGNHSKDAKSTVFCENKQVVSFDWLSYKPLFLGPHLKRSSHIFRFRFILTLMLIPIYKSGGIPRQK